MRKVINVGKYDIEVDEGDLIPDTEFYEFVTRSGTLYRLTPARYGWVDEGEWGVTVPASLYREDEKFMASVVEAYIPRDGGRAFFINEDASDWLSTSPVMAYTTDSWCRTFDTAFWRGPNGHYEIPDNLTTGKEILAYINK